jgi:ABC-type methionine transport system permease subunit
VINTIIGFSLLALATINSMQYKMDVFDFLVDLYTSVWGLLLFVFLLPLRHVMGASSGRQAVIIEEDERS